MYSRSSPTKRRKTRGSSGAMAPKFAKGKEKAAAAKSDAVWPPKLIPTELFNMTITYLPRTAIQNMRLVNKEFEEKVSAYLFKVVVVPFKPEIYGITPELSHSQDPRASDDEMIRGSIMLQDKGMRVFQGFGKHILRFAMSFEFDIAKLTKPPAKNDHDTITTFWGTYKWPFKKYNRYAQLEGLEQTADETRTMAKALRYMTKATELGLSIDGGLGWLAGPDTNEKVVARGGKVAVFGASRFAPEPHSRIRKCGKTVSPYPSRLRFTIGSSDRELTPIARLSVLQRVLREAGYHGDLLQHSLRMLLGEEEQAEEQAHTEALAESSPAPWQNHGLLGLHTLAEHSLRSTATSALGTASTGPTGGTRAADYHSDEDEIATDNDEDTGTQIAVRSSSKFKVDTNPLKPNDLTSAQKEMLLELEWAQRAFMQSYAIAIIDNPQTFRNIQSLTIARLPNRHLPILRRTDFWDSLPGLEKFSLAIIPDWRDVVKLPTSWVQDNRLQPSSAVAGVFQFLFEQISQRKNIKHLHFEWLCGGEYAPGLFSRNQHILVAPVVSKPAEMINRIQQPRMLSLPHVEHLSLKNCWLSPHIFTQFTQSLKMGSLQCLTLDSVSLCAPITPGTHPNPVTHPNHHNNAVAANAIIQHLGHANQNAAQQNFLQVQAGPAIPAMAPVQGGNDPVPTESNWLDAPRNGSWAHTIELLTPSTRLADLRYSQDLSEEPAPHKNSSLRKLEFTSCGYVRLSFEFDQTALDEPFNHNPVPSTAHVAKRINDIEPIMMKPNDTMLGTIANYINDHERKTLENAWNMTVEWDLNRMELKHEAHQDGINRAGIGRFSGLIETASKSEDGP